jgi:cytochrome P450 family 6
LWEVCRIEFPNKINFIEKLFAGFETSSATMSFCLYELCKNLDVQRKVQNELDEEFANDEEFYNSSYESFNNLKYLEACVDETLRMYPPLSILFRTCTKNFNIPNTDLVIEKGTSIHIPIVAIQRDAEIYENPLQFTPERFLNSANGNGNAKGLFYLPFGSGPRHCKC